ncbi:MAG: penicillin-binding protein activator LpoB [Vicingaceae bacterium]
MIKNVTGVLVLLSLMACGQKVSRIDASETTDLSGRWNETDSRLVAEEMVKDALSRPWAMTFQADKDRNPVLVVGLVRNLSHEHISSGTFIKDIEREILNSGRAKIVTAGDARNELRDERAEQQEFASAETAKQWGKELGADFILQGTINSIVDQNKKEKAIFYQVNMELTNVETNEKVWIGDKKIKKLVKK